MEEDAKALHDRAARGESLSAAERAELEAWYARLDAEEMALLAGAPSPGDLEALRAQVDEARDQLRDASERIQAQAAENERIRREIADLERQLTSRPSKQPA
jgi:uncharacterized protein involved in exopolysaccharide biosynthesis